MRVYSRCSKPPSVRLVAATGGGPAALVALILGAIAWHRGMEGLTVAKHSLTTIAACLAVVASSMQAFKAREKARHHEVAEQRESDLKLREMHHADNEHFKAVGSLWFVVAAGAFLSVIGEGVDFFII